MIKQLEKYEKNHLNSWFDLEEAEQTEFLRNLVHYFEQNRNELNSYCAKLKPKEFSSLSLIYEALSVYSYKFNDFLFEEIKRVVLLAKKNNIKPSKLEILEDIELEDIYEKDYATYKNIIDFLISNLNNSNSDELNISLFELIEYFLIDSNENEQYEEWENQLNSFKESASEKVKNIIAHKKSKNGLLTLLGKGGVQLQILFFVGVILQIFAISLYRKTIIETKISVGIYIIVGIIGLILFNSKLKLHMSSLFQRIVLSIVTFGGITVFLFLFLNYQFASKTVTNNKYKIIEKSSLPGRKHHRSERSPTVYIMENNIKKEIVYPYSKTQEVENASYLVIEKSKGLFGFDIIKNKKLE